MNIVEVQFTKDTQSQYTGNEYYRAGTRAHFYSNQAAMLVKQGRAEFCKPPREEVSVSPPVLDYKSMTVKQLKALAHERGIAASRMRKAELVAALED